ncbi:MAG TPA: chemotaxis protein CheB [Kofleriaceae bacterium]|nr:chemotaxis protein CheB [Kofleriaceae bacterium]
MFGHGHSPTMSATEHKTTERERTLATDELALAVVVVGMSAGGLSALRTILSTLRPFPAAAMVIAHHVGETSILPSLINAWTGLDARFASDEEPLCPGRVYVCPGLHHVIVKPDGTLGIPRRERVASVRPSIDWLFESAAGSFGNRTIAILLSGANGDGSLGAACVAAAGGIVIVQDPRTCSHVEMPSLAIAAGTASYVSPPASIADILAAELARVAVAYPNGWRAPFDEGAGATARG